MTRSELLSLLGKGAVAYVLKPPFVHYKGFEWHQALPSELASEPADTNASPTRSRLLLCEDESMLGPGHATDADIGGIGRGAYLHWSSTFYFSASDNSDPNTNGRTYSIVLGPDRTNLVAFGSCHADAMLRSMAGRKPVNQIYIGALTHYTAEMLQVVRICREGVDIPPPLLRYIFPNPDLAILDARDALDTAEGIIIEVCNADEITFGSFYLNRNLLSAHLLLPLQSMGEPIQAQASDWFYNGILGYKEDIRSAAAEKLLALLPAGDPDADMHREIVQHARGRRQDEQSLKRDIAALRDLVSPNVCVLGHILRYMPDGRPLYWPPTFMRQMKEICRDLNLPILDPALVVQEKGVKFSLQDERYYTREFIEEMGNRLYEAWVGRLEKGSSQLQLGK